MARLWGKRLPDRLVAVEISLEEPMFTPKPGTGARIVAFSILLACFGPASLPAQPPLTLIQDVLYKADGSRFNGFVQISWNSFEAGDTSND